MQRFRTGAARLALEHGVPVVPVAIRGSFAAMPRGRGWPRAGRFPVSVRYGPAIRAGREDDVRAFSERTRDGIARLMDEDRTTWWESMRREADGVTPDVLGPDGAAWRRVWEATAPISDGRRAAVWHRGR
jgi:1-acyl-sn-glycerol-3-phosphate acyltransferase